MSDSKIVRICGTLCIVFALTNMLAGIDSGTFGGRFLRFDPTDESSMIVFQYFLNFLLSAIILASSTIIMYLALAGYYFYGAIGKDAWAKILFGGLVAFAIVEVGIDIIFSFLWFLNSIKIIDIFDGVAKDFYQFWFNPTRWRFNLLTPLISIAFGIKALAARKVDLSVQLVPIFAAVLYLFVTYPTFFGSNHPGGIVPNLIAILILSGLMALYFKGAVGENIWAKVLLGVLLLIMIINIVLDRTFAF